MEIKLINEINLSPADQHQVAVFAKMNCLGSADFRDQNGSRMLKGSHWSHHRCKNGNLSVPSLQNRALHLPSAMERSAPRRPLGWQAAAFARPAAFASPCLVGPLLPIFHGPIHLALTDLVLTAHERCEQAARKPCKRSQRCEGRVQMQRLQQTDCQSEDETRSPVRCDTGPPAFQDE